MRRTVSELVQAWTNPVHVFTGTCRVARCILPEYSFGDTTLPALHLCVKRKSHRLDYLEDNPYRVCSSARHALKSLLAGKIAPVVLTQIAALVVPWLFNPSTGKRESKQSRRKKNRPPSLPDPTRTIFSGRSWILGPVPLLRPHQSEHLHQKHQGLRARHWCFPKTFDSFMHWHLDEYDNQTSQK